MRTEVFKRNLKHIFYHYRTRPSKSFQVLANPEKFSETFHSCSHVFCFLASASNWRAIKKAWARCVMKSVLGDTRQRFDGISRQSRALFGLGWGNWHVAELCDTCTRWYHYNRTASVHLTSQTRMCVLSYPKKTVLHDCSNFLSRLYKCMCMYCMNI